MSFAKPFTKSSFVGSPAGGAIADVAYDGVFVRQRETRDADALLRMFDQPQCRLGMVCDPFKSADEFETWLRNNGCDNFEAVATVADTAIALGALFPGQDTQRHAAWLVLFVHDHYQGRGIGTLLMSVLVTTAHVLGLTRMQLTVVCRNERAIALYRKFGFEIEGRHEYYARRGDEFVTALTMARITPEGSPRYGAMERLCRDLRGAIATPAA